MAHQTIAPANWWDTAMIYEIYLRSFQDSNGDGIGDLPGLISRLDYLNDGTPDSLGIDAIWLTPIYPSPLYDFGYDISDFTDIDPMYGSMEQFQHFTSLAHERGIKIIMDLVANHTSHQHAWFQASRLGRDNPKRNWYVWRDAAEGGGPPNNWLSVFGGSAWTFDEDTGQYYLHSFLPQQPDLNWRNPAVRQAMFDVVRFWTSRGVDGFRLDAIAHIAKDELLRDNPLSAKPLPPGSTGYEAQVHLYDHNDAIIHDWLTALRVVLDEDGKPRMMVSEIYGLDPEDVARYHGALGPPEMHMSFNFDVLEAPWRATEVRAAVDSFEQNLPSNVWPNVVLNNHDRPRFVSRHDADGHGEERARLAAILLLTLRGAAYLYYGEEIGMRDGTIPRDRLQDPVGVRFWPENLGRDPERTPMQWAPELGAGFTSGRAWLPIGPDLDRINVQTESRDPSSILNLYRRLALQRRSSKAIRAGAYLPLDAVPPDTYCYLRDAVNDRVLVLLNFASEHRQIDLEALGRGDVLADSHPARVGSLALWPLILQPFEGLVIQLQS